ncbi:3505_t:CDS:2, partial [Gigaspora margarita]
QNPSKLSPLGCVTNPYKELPGCQKLFNSEDIVILKQLVYKKVDWYLNKLVYEIEKMTRKHASVASLWRSLRYCEITPAQERNKRARSSFIAKIRENYTCDQLIFLDESSKDERNLTCYYGYSFIDTCVQKKIVFVRKKRYTILLALIIDGIIALDIIEGSCNRK